MTPSDVPPRRKSAFTLVRELVGGFVALAKLEIQHGKQEIGQSVGHVKGGTINLAITLVLAFVTLITLLAVIVAALFVLGLWWAALILLLLFILLTGFFAWRGIRELRQVKPMPEETIASVKEEMAWAKRLIRRE